MNPILRTILPLLAAGLLHGAAPARSAPHEPTRALWVTRFDYRTQADVERVVSDAASAGINTLVFQVRGNATALYKSPFEPWAEQFDFKDPGFDPLEVALRAARARGIALHAWVNVMPAWWGTKPPADKRQVWHTKPEWMWYDQHGKRQELCERFYVSLNPCLPEVRAYLADVMRDIAERYAVDGLHLDYIRFPNEAPATPKGSGADYPRDARTVALFRQETGKDPAKDRAAWDRWRAEQVTHLVRGIRKAVKGARGTVELSAAVGPAPEKSAGTYFQDSRAWLAEGLLDAVYPMNYAADLATFEQRCQVWREIAGDARVVMGIMLGGKDVAAHRDQLALAQRMFPGWCLFAYAKVWDSPGDALESQSEAARKERAELRKALVPLLLQFARTPGSNG